MKLDSKTRYVIDITGTDPLSSGELGGRRFNFQKLKNEIFLTYEGVIGSK